MKCEYSEDENGESDMARDRKIIEYTSFTGTHDMKTKTIRLEMADGNAVDFEEKDMNDLVDFFKSIGRPLFEVPERARR